MTHNYHHQIDRIVKANKIYRFESELEECEDTERIKTLTQLVNQYNAHKDEKQIKEDKLKAHLQLLKDSQYQKKWQFLNQKQKLNRIDEFIERRGVTDEKIIKLIREAVTTGALKTKDVDYDVIKSQIQDLTVLAIDDETKECKLNRTAIGKSDSNSDSDHDDQNNNQNDDQASDRSETKPKIKKVSKIVKSSVKNTSDASSIKAKTSQKNAKQSSSSNSVKKLPKVSKLTASSVSAKSPNTSTDDVIKPQTIKQTKIKKVTEAKTKVKKTTKTSNQ